MNCPVEDIPSMSIPPPGTCIIIGLPLQSQDNSAGAKSKNALVRMNSGVFDRASVQTPFEHKI